MALSKIILQHYGMNMFPTLKMSDLRNLSPEERNKKIKDFIQIKPPSTLEAIEVLNEKISTLEEKHQITSSEMRNLVSLGELVCTWEIDTWLIYLHLKERLENKR